MALTVKSFTKATSTTIAAQSVQVSVDGVDQSYVTGSGGTYRYSRRFDAYFTYTPGRQY